MGSPHGAGSALTSDGLLTRARLGHTSEIMLCNIGNTVLY